MDETVKFYNKSIDEVYDKLGTGPEGLSDEEAGKRLEEHGPNEIRSEDEINPFKIFISQFQDFLIYLLFLAVVVSLGVGLFPGHEPEYVDAVLIMLIIIGNGIFGFIQDYKAEKAIEALKDLSSPDATVIRDGKRQTVSSKEVVPGDIVLIEQGNAIPADARLVETSSLQSDESALTGESMQVSKNEEPLDEDTPMAERKNMIFMNTTAVLGRGKAVVTATGMDTEVGQIATQISEAEERETPFQEEVDSLGKKIGLFILVIIGFVAVAQTLFTDATILSVFLVAISLAVAAVPEGLPAVVTLTLALGSKKMLKQNALVRRLPVVESLGSVNYIVTDKTGTLTEDHMTVRKIFFNDLEVQVSGGATGDGDFEADGEKINPKDELEPILKAGFVCNNAEQADGEAEKFFGDPTESALLVSAMKAGVTPTPERVREVPFSSKRKRMTVVTVENEGHKAYMKGAPEVILERCNKILQDGGEVELTDEKRKKILDKNSKFASDALRVLGFAYKKVDDPDMEDARLESDMVFLGLQGMIDPPREEVSGAVEDCRSAGIKVVMATGDNIETAKAIGKQVGFNPEGAKVGAQVDKMSDDELAQAVENTEIFARVSPSHKVSILQALQSQGHRVAMTGDGVNDAPALKNSDVGIAMGIRGTDVAKQASSMILRDDNFVTIKNAIAEGRGIFDNIRKFVSYLLSYNAGEVLLVFFGILLGGLLWPNIFHSGKEALVLTPVMLLWVNLVTDGLPALALGADPKVPHIMNRPPRDKDEPVIDKRMMLMILGIGIAMTLTILPIFFRNVDNLVLAQTLAFTALVVFEMVGIQAIRRVYEMPVFSNGWLWAAIAGALGLHMAVLYTPISEYFDVVPLQLEHWAEIGVALVVFFVLVEILVKIEDVIFDKR